MNVGLSEILNPLPQLEPGRAVVQAQGEVVAVLVVQLWEGRWIELTWMKLTWMELTWMELTWIELVWIELTWIELTCIKLTWIKLIRS